MKTCHKFLLIAICLALLVSLAAPAFAATATAIFVRETVDGYECICQGNIYDEVNPETNVTTYVAHGGFKATVPSGISSPTDPTLCTSRVTMLVYGENNELKSVKVSDTGHLEAGVIYSQTGGTPIAYADYAFEFNGLTWGTYRLNAN